MNLISQHTLFRQKPPAPPPTAVPQYCPILCRVDSCDIGLHYNYYIYVWLKSGNSFWMFPTDQIGDTLFCYAWDGADWNYIKFDKHLIDSFY